MNYVNIVTAFSALMSFLALMGVIGLVRLDAEKKRKVNTCGYCEPKSINRVQVFYQGAEPYRRDLNANERLLMTTLDDGRMLRVLIGKD